MTSLSMGAFVLGAVLLLASLISGTFKIFGAEVTGSVGTSFRRFVAFVLGCVLVVVGVLLDGRSASHLDEKVAPRSSEHSSSTELSKTAPAQTTAARPSRRLKVSWSFDQTGKQMAWLRGQNLVSEDFERLASAGEGLHAIELFFVNVGSEPVEVSPTNVRIYVGGKSTSWTAPLKPHYLGRVRLSPGDSTRGFITFLAPAGIAAAVVSYEDSGVQVSYAR